MPIVPLAILKCDQYAMRKVIQKPESNPLSMLGLRVTFGASGSSLAL